MLLIYVLCDTLQFYYIYYAFAKLYSVLCVWTSGPQYEGTCPWTLGQVAMEGFLVLERLQHCSRLLHAQLGGSDPCSEGRGYNAARIIQSYTHTIIQSKAGFFSSMLFVQPLCLLLLLTLV